MTNLLEESEYFPGFELKKRLQQRLPKLQLHFAVLISNHDKVRLNKAKVSITEVEY